MAGSLVVSIYDIDIFHKAYIGNILLLTVVGFGAILLKRFQRFSRVLGPDVIPLAVQ